MTKSEPGAAVYSLPDIEADIKLNQNETPWDWPKSFKQEVCDLLMEQDWNRYPSFFYESYETKLANNLGIATDNILLTPGSNGLIQAWFNQVLGEGEQIAVPVPSFGVYDELIRFRRGNKISLTLGDNGYDEDFLKQINELDPSIPLIICAPNNPTGDSIDREMIYQIAKKRKGPVLWDAAYAAFADMGSAQIWIKDMPENLVICQTFSKDFGLPSARLGYGVLPSSWKTSLQASMLPYQINRFSLAAFEVLCQPNWWQWRKDQIIELKNEKERMIQKWSTFNDWEIQAGEANFFRVRNKKYSSEQLFILFLDQGILIRKYPNWIRITIGTKEENNKVLGVVNDL